MKVGGRAAEWSKEKYAGSIAEDLWRRLDAMEVVNQGMLFAATLLLCLFPFLIVASALAGRPLVNTLARYTGLNNQAAADVGHLFASSAATASAVVGTAPRAHAAVAAKVGIRSFGFIVAHSETGS